MPDSDGAPSRIAIKLGSSSSGAAKKHARPTPPSSLGKRHRAQALHGDHSGSEDEDGGAHGKHEEISTYGPDGASSDDRRQRRRTRSRSPERRRKGHRHDKRREDESHKETELADKDKDVQWGLTINKKPGSRDEGDRKAGTQSREGSVEVKNGERETPKTADEEAMDALLGNDKDRKRAAVTEGDDVDRDPVPEDYEKVPIDEFGAHLLKNFGWDGKMVGKVKDVKKHANLTGLGAKGKGAEDLGAWSQKPIKDGGGHDKPRRPRLDEYRREEEKRKQRREERQRESERHRDSRESSHRRDRDSDRDRHRDRESDRRDRDRDRDRDR
ncbi:hypothetical protein NKR19_g7972 [Coniochaeta hoffmannii]|uniref:Spp2/MOS2 G-patch domain-containing protein n=1 Tax=Coniochaeta hoffmannii TaxID=91930 RepID=A0AA38RSD0_9PEZI|nr:hypothetical protein NKR19_g7972 [Coniochaeta hoffmannii]